MAEQGHKPETEALTRRDFIQSVAAGGAGLWLSQAAFGQKVTTTTTTLSKPGAPAILASGPAERVNVGLIGCGQWGRQIINASRAVPELQLKAVCDIWEYQRKYAQRYLKALRKQETAAYEDYRAMLADAKKLGLDAVIVATPDWLHAEQSIAAMEAGLHCYCEAEMATRLEDARRMIATARRTGKLLQIGRTMRSDPHYRFPFDELLHKRNIFGRLAVARAHWSNTSSFALDRACPKGAEMTPGVLARHGYPSMHHFCNWQWYRPFGIGPVARIGGMQIDVLNWFLENRPVSLMAGGIRRPERQVVISQQRPPGLRRDWCEDVMGILEYATPEGPLMASFQTVSAIGGSGRYESFEGEHGEITVSEYRSLNQATSRDTGMWQDWVEEGVLLKKSALTRKQLKEHPAFSGDMRRDLIDSHETIDPEEFVLPVEMNEPFGSPHLRNFCDAIRNGTPLNCPGEVGYVGLVAALAINRAIETGAKVTFKPEDFVVG